MSSSFYGLQRLREPVFHRCFPGLQERIIERLFIAGKLEHRVKLNALWPVERVTVTYRVLGLVTAADAAEVSADVVGSADVVVALWVDWTESSFRQDARVRPSTTAICFGVKEPAFFLEFVTFSNVTIVLFHAIGMLCVELVGEAHVRVKHHLLETLVARYIVDTFPLVFVRIIAHVSLGTPASGEHGFVVSIVEFALVFWRAPVAIVS